MKKDNIFRFVSIRVAERKEVRKVFPERPGGSTPIPPSGLPPSVPDSIEQDFFILIRNEIETGLTHGEAVVKVAREFISSNNYVMKNRDWKSFLPLEGPLGFLIEEIKDNGNVESLESEIDIIFNSHLATEFSLLSFLSGEKFHQMNKNLWFSYYSNMILRDQRPGDRPVLIFWIRVFHMISNFDKNRTLINIMANFDSLQPAVPYHFLTIEEAEQQNLDEADDQESPNDSESLRIKKINEVGLALKNFEEAKIKINRVYKKKKGLAAKRGANNLSIANAAIVANAREDTSPPWELKRDDLDSVTLQFIEDNGISIEDSLIPEIVADLESRLAQKFSELYDLQHVEEIVRVRGVLVKKTIKKY